MLAAVAVIGCGPHVIIMEVDGGTGSTSGPATPSSSSTDPLGLSTSTTTTPAPGTTFGGESGESSSSTGESITGPGCGPPPVCDRGTYDGDLFVSSPDEIAGYTEITGSLSVFRSDFVCLDFLSCMQTVGDVFQVFENNHLRDLSGTNAIVDVGAADPTGDRSVVYITANYAVTRLNGFGSLSTVDELTIQQNDGLQSITGFGSLVDIRRELLLFVNPALTDLGTIAALDGPADRCWIEHTNVCQSVAVAVCGPVETVTDNNDGC